MEARLVPKKPEAPFFSDDGLVVARVEARVDVDPAAAELEHAEGRHLLQPEPAVLAVRLEADRRVDDREALRPRRVEQPSRCLDLRRQVGAERALGVGEPAVEVDHEHGGPLAQRELLAEPGPLVDLACLLIAHGPPFSRRPRSRA